MAEERDLDLVEISPNAKPPVCKIIDYKKFLYEQKRKQKELKAKQVKVVIKEIRFGPNTDEHDFQFKLKHAVKFLSEGAKLKAFVFFKGRSIIYKDRGEILLLKFAQELEEFGVLEKSYKVSIKNNKNKVVNLVLIDQIPVSNKKSIDVQLTESSEASYTKNNGKLVWNLKLNPDDTVIKKFSFSVKHPEKDKIYNF